MFCSFYLSAFSSLLPSSLLLSVSLYRGVFRCRGWREWRLPGERKEARAKGEPIARHVKTQGRKRGLSLSQLPGSPSSSHLFLSFIAPLSLSFYPLLLLAPIFLPRLSPPSIARASLADEEEGYFTGLGKVSSATGFFHVTTRQGCHGKRNKRSLAGLDV